MAHLYLDTSNGLQIGLLNSDFEWINFKKVETKRTSDIVHSEISKILSGESVEIMDLESVVLMAGPGSYTGMRVAEGVAQVLELEGVKIYSFHSFRIPEFLKIENYHWCYPAFKGEVHVNDGKESKLLMKEDFLSFVKGGESPYCITHGDNEVLEFCSVNTEDSLQNDSKLIFSSVVESDLRDRPFYFRPLDVEFKKSTK